MGMRRPRSRDGRRMRRSWRVTATSISTSSAARRSAIRRRRVRCWRRSKNRPVPFFGERLSSRAGGSCAHFRLCVYLLHCAGSGGGGRAGRLRARHPAALAGALLRVPRPEKQKNGFRLDRRSTAFSGLVRHNIIAGSSQTSRVYLRTVSAQFGIRMPPNHELDDDEIDLIRRWIDEGAVWPDELANESPPKPLDADAVEFVERLRVVAHSPGAQAGLRAEFMRTPALLNLRGPGGATPLMFIALYGDASLLSAALDAGGDARRHSD